MSEIYLEKIKRSITLTGKEWICIIENLDGWDALKKKIFAKLISKGETKK